MEKESYRDKTSEEDRKRRISADHELSKWLPTVERLCGFSRRRRKKERDPRSDSLWDFPD